MPISVYHVRRVVTGLCLAVLFALPIGAQSPGAAPPTYDRPDEIAALDALRAQVMPPASGGPLNPDDLIEISRLLSSPCDQIRWLLAQFTALSADTAQQRAASQLAQGTLRRGQELTAARLLQGCDAELAALADAAKRLASLDTIVDPALLKARLEQTASLTDQPAYTRFVLLARGAPARKAFARNATESWDMPRLVLDRLAERPELPSIWDLRDWQQRLVTAYQDWTAKQAAQMGSAEQQQNVTVTFAIAAAWTDRALGLDAQDLAGTTPVIAYPTAAAEWQARAAALDQAGLWGWAALANILAASPAAGQTANAEALAAAQAAWKSFREINNASWAALDEASNGWLPRLATGRPVQPKLMPLSADFRAAARTDRATREREATQLLGQAAGAVDDAARARLADDLFKTIQLAKAAEAGLTVTPLSVDDLKRELGEVQLLYLFVEVLQLPPAAAGQSPSYCAVAVYRKLYQERMAGVEYTDEYLSKIVQPQPSLRDVVTAALAAPGPPLLERGAIRKDARIIIAPDGPLPADWFQFESQTLLQPAEWGLKPAWLVYTPSAAAMKSDQWTLGVTLQTWSRTALRLGVPRPTVTAPPATLGVRGAGAPLERAEMTIYVVNFGERPAPTDRNRLSDFVAARRSEVVSAVPVWVSK